MTEEVSATWWHPFMRPATSDHYTAGPFAMTSNTREDNPVWNQIAEFNRAQARLTYVATLGDPAAQIAWLLPHGEWRDETILPGRGLCLNSLESQASRALIAGGLEYDRISRRDLTDATPQRNALVVGQARYQALLLTDLVAVAPELLENIIALARHGVPIVWLGPLPTRALGWCDHEVRDEKVRSQSQVLEGLVRRCASTAELASAFAALRVRAELAPADGSPLRLRMHRRVVADEQFILLFNESAEALVDRYVVDLQYRSCELLHPESGEIASLAVEPGAGGGRVEISVPPGRMRVLRLAAAPQSARGGQSSAASGWSKDVWSNPPKALHPFIRWWWPGNAVDKNELRRELQRLHYAGFAGVELQTLTLGFTTEQLRKHRDSIYQVGTPAYFDNLRAVFEAATQLGMTVDLTLGSGWSSGGPFIERHREQQLIMSSLDLSEPGQIDIAVPLPQEPPYVGQANSIIRNTIGEFDDAAELQVVVVAKVDTATEPPTLTELTDISAQVVNGRINWVAPGEGYRLFAFHRNASSHNACGSAYPGALERSPILDHLDRGGVEEYIEKLGEPWLAALQPFKPEAFFVDSFELIAELPWSSGFRTVFEEMHGYDLAPWLPLVFQRGGESKYVYDMKAPGLSYRGTDDRGQRVREDYLATRERLFRDMFLQPLKAWMGEKGIKLRLQAHGGYGDYLDSYQLADIPEAEGLFGGGSFDFLKLASSAAHVAGRRVISSESFITLTLDHNALDINDYYLLAGNAFAAGINRTVCHGYAYHFPL